MAEQLLDDAEGGAALEQVRGEGMAETVRVPKEPANGARVEPTSARGEEDGVVRTCGQLGPPGLEVAREVKRGLLAERHDALLASLASHVHDLAVEVDVSEVERHGLLAPQPGGVEEFEQGTVAQRKRRCALDDPEQLVDLR